MSTILITGGTGLIGKHLTEFLVKKGYTINILSRSKTIQSNTFYWNVKEGFIEEKAITSADYIIHLAGANIAEKRWTIARKNVLIDSRVESANLLFKKVKKLNPNLKAFISASGIGFYGAVTSDKIFTEEDKPANDFISKICIEWENSAKQFETIGCRTVILRTGVVFAKAESALQKIAMPIKYGFGTALGNGNQFMPWILINDLCNMYLEAIKNTNLEGIYNAVAPEQITNKQLSKTIATTFKKPFWLPNTPSFILKLIFGEMAVILLEGSRVSSQKIEKTGFQFQFPTILDALKNLL